MRVSKLIGGITGGLAASLLTAGLVAAGCSGRGRDLTMITPNPPGGDWTNPQADPGNTRFQPQTAIDSTNITQLGVAWSFSLASTTPEGTAVSNPVVVGNTIYVQDQASNVYAIDRSTGALRWKATYDSPVDGFNGPAVSDERVFALSNQRTLVALNITSGQELWSLDLQGRASIQPLVVQNQVFLGTTGSADGQAGTGGRALAVSATDGTVQWSFDVAERGLWGNPELNSGGGITFAPAFDDVRQTVYFGTGGPAPFPGTVQFPNGSSRPGANLFTNSLIALDVGTGELRWHQQVSQHNLFGHDLALSPIIAEVSFAGQTRQVILASGTLGVVYAMDAESHEVLWSTPVGTHENDDLQELPVGEPVTVLPGARGGVATPMSFRNGVLYVSAINLPTEYTADAWGATNAQQAAVNIAEHTARLDTATTDITAIDATGGAILWTTRLQGAGLGATTVFNDLVLTSTSDGMLHALSRADGSELWSLQVPGPIHGWPAIGSAEVVLVAGAGANRSVFMLRLNEQGTFADAGADAAPEAATDAAPEAATDTGPDGREPSDAAADAEPDAAEDAAADAATDAAAEAGPDATADAQTDAQPDAGTGAPVTVSLTAQDMSFSTNTIRVPASSQVVIQMTNNDSLPHNFALYPTSAAQTPIFQGEVFSGPDATRTFEFTAPSEPGDYYFQCDVHPEQMNGTFVVTP